MRAILAPAIAIALAGCVTSRPDSGGPAPLPLPQSWISYETSACYGRCPVYSVTIGSDGSGRFVGKRFTAVEGERSFTVTPDQFAAFARLLAPYRPESGAVRYAPGEPNCVRAPTDQPSVEVKWTYSFSPPQQLDFYFGCSGENAAIAGALRRAPSLLPIEALIGPRP